MTDNTQPLALMLAEQYDYGDPAAHSNTWKVAVCTELRRQHARIAELKARVQELGAMARENRSRRIVELEAQLEALRAALAASPTTPAEQQATKETSGGFHVWRDISTAPKDGSRFVATGHNYGLYSEVRHTCVAQWFRGCWMEASDWNETSELKYLTHWMPLPSPPDDVAAPAEQQAAPKAAPGEPTDSDGFGSAEHWKEKAQYWAGVAHRLRGEALRGEPVDGIVHPPAPKQEAQEPVAVPRFNCWSTNEGDSWFDHPADSQAIYDCLGNDAKVGDEYELTAGWTSVTARYRITEVVGDGEEYEVECISHPHENSAPQPAPVVGRMSPSKEWLETRLAIADDSDVQAGVPSKNARPCDAPPGCDSHNCHGCDDFKHPSPTPQPAPAPLSDDAKDAARYRWLREGNDAKHGAAWHVAVNLYGCEWDAAIDAAIATKGDTP